VSVVNLRGPQRDSGQNELLLVGYRNGNLVMICYQITSERVLKETSTSQHPMGSTPVTFKTDPATPNVAFICCDSKLWRVTYDCTSNAEPLLHRVWFTAVESVSFIFGFPSPNPIFLLPLKFFLFPLILPSQAYYIAAPPTATIGESRGNSTSRFNPVQWESTFSDIAGS
jgi:hypothetical protein